MTTKPKRGRKPGTAKTGGRQKGTPNRTSSAQREWIMGNANPLEFLASVMKGERFPQPQERTLFTIYPTEDQRIDAAKQLLRRVSPELKPVEMPLFDLQARLVNIERPEQVLDSINAIMSMVLEGEITPSEASVLAAIVDKARNAIDTDLLSKEIEELKRVIEMQGGE